MGKNKFYSYNFGDLSKGCKLCVKGEKLVLFITGVCSEKCFFCPISEQKKNRDVIYANERPIKELNEIIEEANLCEAKGAGITGGDPLLKLERTTTAITLLKQKFSKNFHIHLYTPLSNVKEEKLKLLFNSGLDEIRFHPKLDDKSDWEKINIARRFDWSVGVEIPVIPGYETQTKELIHFIKGKVDFLNLNELEISSTNCDNLAKLGLFAKDDISYGVKGSEELALELLKLAESLGIPSHYCTTTLKDRVQLSRRILRRAKNIKKKFDRMTDEGMLIRGAVYLEGLVPGFNYRERISKTDKELALKDLQILKQDLQKKFSLSQEMLHIDENKLRLLTSESIARRLSKKIKNKCAVVEEYPTFDQFEVEVEML